jgi:hypothetical protein
VTELESEKFDAGEHAPRCLVCFEELTELDEAVYEIGGFVGANNDPHWWVTFRLAHSACAESVLDSREVRYRLAYPDEA